MSRKKNPYKTVLVKVSTTPKVAQYLDALVATGLFGKTAPEASERLIAQRVDQLIKEGTIKRLEG